MNNKETYAFVPLKETIQIEESSSNNMISKEYLNIKSKLYLQFAKPKSTIAFSLDNIKADVNGNITENNALQQLYHSNQQLKTVMSNSNPKALAYIEKVFSQIIDTQYKDSLIFHFNILHSSLSTLPLNKDSSSSLVSNLSIILNKVKHIISTDYNIMLTDFGYDTYCLIELLYVSIGTYLQMFIPFNLYTPILCDDEQFVLDMSNLILLYELYPCLNSMISAIIELNGILRCKAFLALEVSFDKRLFQFTQFKWFYEYYTPYTQVLFLIQKFALFPAFITKSSCTDLFNMNTLIEMSINLHWIFEENMIICYKNNKSLYKVPILARESFETLIMLGLYRNELYTSLRFLKEDYYIDCMYCFPSLHSFTTKFFMHKLQSLLSNQFKTLLEIINRAKEREVIEICKDKSNGNDYTNLTLHLLKAYVHSLKGHFTCQFIASFYNDNIYDNSNKNSWLVIFLNVFNLAEAVLALMFIVNEYNMSITNGLELKKKDSIVLDLTVHLANSLMRKFHLYLPLKMYAYKLTMMKNILVLLDYILGQCGGIVLQQQIRSLPFYTKLIDTLKEISTRQSLFLFYFSNRILRILLTKEYHKQKMRVYGLMNYPFDYMDFDEETAENTNKILNSNVNKLNVNINAMTGENKENISILANSQIKSSIENPNMPIETKSMQSMKAYYDLNKVKDYYPIEELLNAADDMFRFRNKTEIILVNDTNEPIILMQLPNKTNLILNKDIIGFPAINTILSHMFADFNQREYLIYYLYNEMLVQEMSQEEFINFQNCIKYYDIKNSIKYFDFVDSLDVLLE